MPDTYIVINRHRIRTKEPPIRISKGKHGRPTYASRIRATGPVELIYDPDNPIMPCGARLALRTAGEVEIVA